MEAFLKAAYEKYWEEMQPHAHFLGQVLVKEFCEFLKKTGEVWTKVRPDTTFESLRNGYAIMETSLRKYLIRGGANLGERILEEPVQEMTPKAIAAINKEAQAQATSSEPYIKFDKQGTPVKNEALRCSEKGFKIGQAVQAAKVIDAIQVGTALVIKDITAKGVTVALHAGVAAVEVLTRSTSLEHIQPPAKKQQKGRGG